MLQWVYEGACNAKSLDKVIVATDDPRIAGAAEGFGAEVRMTSSHHTSGTSRAAEVVSERTESIVLQIQGDEPLLQGSEIDALAGALAGEERAGMVTLYTRQRDMARIHDPNVVKVVMDSRNRALYFSRSPLPHAADDYFYQHIGIYACRREFLLGYDALPPSRLERLERLEQLRALENGWEIRLVETSRPGLSVDTPEDIIRVEQFLKKDTDG